MADEPNELRVVVVLSRATYCNQDPELVAAVTLAKVEGEDGDLIKQPEGIYMSTECWKRIRTYQVWLSEKGEIFITKGPAPSGLFTTPKVFSKGEAAAGGSGPAVVWQVHDDSESKRFLGQFLQTAKRLGELHFLEYAVGLANKLGFDCESLMVLEGLGRVAVW
jgi:hypothetical protein